MSASPDAIHIRPATVDDSEALAEVYISSARHHASLDPEYYHVPDPGAVIRHLRKTLAADSPVRTARLVAEVEGMVLGSADVTLQSPNPASMIRPTVAASVGLAVLEDQRGGGIGSRLMAAAEEWARQRGATLMMLDASAANVEARRFYERHGYRLRGVLPRHRRRELVERLLGWTDRLIIGVFNEEAHDRPTEHLLRSWGLRIDGRSERAHRTKPGMEYRVLWIDAS